MNANDYWLFVIGTALLAARLLARVVIAVAR